MISLLINIYFKLIYKQSFLWQLIMRLKRFILNKLKFIKRRNNLLIEVLE
ncbi:unnamed protein product [Paramecium sonneborni]|uniref:Uncharacterized protein n=1 Tax=Paramecium sonneborni TaxID=65129 RepID=A0A8S1RJQ8_9CILI|nr:unnamed protein product [Paramecium sonneborni]